MPETDIFDTVRVSNWKTQNEINQKAVKKDKPVSRDIDSDGRSPVIQLLGA